MKRDPYAYLDVDRYGRDDYKPDADMGDASDGEGKKVKNVKNAYGVMQRVADRYLRRE